MAKLKAESQDLKQEELNAVQQQKREDANQKASITIKQDPPSVDDGVAQKDENLIWSDGRPTPFQPIGDPLLIYPLEPNHPSQSARTPRIQT